MKTFFIRLLPLFLITFWRCHTANAPDPLLIGEWVWAGSSGGIAGARYVPRPTDQIILRFNPNGQFNLQRNDTLLSAGTFSMTTIRSIYSGKDAPGIQTQSVVVNKQVKNTPPVVVSGVVSTLTTDQLSIGDNAYDGYGSGFTRRK